MSDASTKVKPEPTTPVVTTVSRALDAPDSPDDSEDQALQDVMKRIIGICQETGQCTERALSLFMDGVDKPLRLRAINTLLSENRLKVGKKGNDSVYILSDDKTASGNQFENNQERVVYDIIENSGNKGIWLREIRNKSNLGQQQLAKVIKALEGRQSIKKVKSVAAGRRLVYMCYNMTPDQSVTGGSWYDNQDFDREFVDLLANQAQHCLVERHSLAMDELDPRLQLERSFISTSDVRDFIVSLKISRVEISLTEMENILDTLVFDGVAEKKVLFRSRSRGDGDAMETDDLEEVSSDSVKLYRARIPSMAKRDIVLGPCHYCPVMSDCRYDSPINPLTCSYFQQWLNW